MRKIKSASKATPTSRMSAAERSELALRTYVFHIVPERAPSVSRTVELLASQTFRDLHHAIQQHFALDDDHMYAFFMSGRAWDQSGIFSDGNPRISLQEGGCKAGKEFLYLFDFGDELLHHIRVESEGTKQEGVSYPRLLASVGEAPEQYPDAEGEEYVPPELDADLLPLAEDLARACEDCFGAHSETELPCEDCGEFHEDLPEADIPVESLDHCVALLTRLGTELQSRPTQIDALDEFCDAMLMEWMESVFDTLQDGERAEDALRLHDLLSPVLGSEMESWLPERHFLLLSAGRKEEATAEMERLLSEHPESSDVLHSAIEFFRCVGDLEQSEACARKMVSLKESRSWFIAASRVLLEVLDARGKVEEATQLRSEIEHAERLQHDAVAKKNNRPQLVPNYVAESPYIAPPKPGRNDACPCGSGKKYKKCCDGKTPSVAQPSAP